MNLLNKISTLLIVFLMGVVAANHCSFVQHYLGSCCKVVNVPDCCKHDKTCVCVCKCGCKETGKCDCRVKKVKCPCECGCYETGKCVCVSK